MTTKPPAKKARAAAEVPPKGDRKAGDSRAILESMGVQGLCEKIIAGQSMRSIAAALEIGHATLVEWVASDADRSKAVRDARANAARTWDEMAEEELSKAKNPFDLAKARELASHYRWRASKTAPAEYGDKLDLKHSGDVVVTVKDYTGRKKEGAE